VTESTQPTTATFRRVSILWVTNTASPYRRPVWDELAKVGALKVALLENDRRLGRIGRRGADWGTQGLGARLWAHEVLKTWRLARGETEIFIASPLQVARSLRSTDSILIGGWESPAYWQVLVMSKILGRRTVGFYESTRFSSRFSRGPISYARARFFRSLDAVVVPGPAALEAVQAMGIPRKKIFVGFNAIDVERFNSEARRTRDAAPIAVVEGHKFIYVGQLVERKNVDGLIAAFITMRNENDSLTIIGSGPLLPRLEALVDSLRLSNAIRFVHAVQNNELAPLLATSQTLVLPSHEEVWGLVANEALACGLQVVVTAQSGVAESIREMVGVEVATDSMAESIAEAMIKSREGWSGWVEHPAILKLTPAVFAATFAAALRAVPNSAN